MNEIDEKLNDSQKQQFRLKYIIPVIAIPLLIIAALVLIVFTQEPKSDPASEKIIREIAGEQLNKHPYELTEEDFAKINFEIIGKKLSDIRLLEKFTNLQRLQLVGIHYPSNKIPLNN